MIVVGFGVSGVGKTTISARAVRINKKNEERYLKKYSNKKLYKWFTEVVSTEERFYCNYKEKSSKEYRKLTGKEYVEYSKYIPHGVERKDTNKFLRFIFNLIYHKNYYDVIYSTDPTIKGTVPITYDMLGTFKPTWNSLFVLEEGGIGMNNRNWKTLSSDAKELFSKGRHSNADIYTSSQTVDIDKSIKNRAHLMFLVGKLGEFTYTRLIGYKVDIDKEKHDLVDMYYKQHWLIWLWQLLTCWRKKFRRSKFPFTRAYIFFRPLYYKYFDSFEDDHYYVNPDPNPDSPEKFCYVPIEDNKDEERNLENEES